MLAALHLVLSATHNLWGGISADYIKRNFDVDAVNAGYWSSVDSLLPCILAPLLGLLVDKVGMRMIFCSFAASCACASFILIRVRVSSPLFPQLLLSLMVSIIPTVVRACVPLVVEPRLLGLAFGIYTIFESIGAAVGHVVVGYIRDVESYTADIDLFICMAAFSVLLCVAIQRVDSRRRGVLAMSASRLRTTIESA